MDMNLIDVSTPSPSRATAIELDDIGRRNPKGEGWLIEGVTLKLHAGDRLGVLGPSGAGKTVLLRAMALLDPLDAGTILWQGRPVRDEGVPLFRKRVIYLHQRPALFDGSVLDNLRLPFALKNHRDRVFDRNRALDLLANLGRDAEFLAKPSRRLSGGEAQLVALVRALELEPAVLLLDEPTASLDLPTTQAVERALEDWLTAGNDGRAFVWVSHDLEQTRRMTTRRIYLRAGRLAPES
jgi:UDP-glucose/iron transport system ATP-binding protein